MTIEVEKKPANTTCKFKDIKVGEVFAYAPSDQALLKLTNHQEHGNAIRLGSSDRHYLFVDTDEVRKVKAKLTWEYDD